MNREHIGVVVLNYLDYESTINCVRSILACRPGPAHIVIVDNASPNESVKELESFARNFAEVDVVDSGRNGGFSAGHNCGIRKLQELGLDDVLLATSDTEVVSEDMFRHFSDAIDDHVGVLGPRIIEPDGKEQNPSIESASLRYFFALVWLFAGRPLQGTWNRVKMIWRPAKRTARTGNAAQDSSPDAPLYRKVYKLHGAMLLLTHTYLEKVGVLDEDLFMFGEEDLIAWNSELNGLDRLLVERAVIRHQNDSSIELAHESRAGQFISEQEYRSAQVLRSKIGLARLFAICTGLYRYAK